MEDSNQYSKDKAVASGLIHPHQPTVSSPLNPVVQKLKDSGTENDVDTSGRHRKEQSSETPAAAGPTGITGSAGQSGTEGNTTATPQSDVS